MYLDDPDDEKYVAATYQKEKVPIERLKLKQLMAKGGADPARRLPDHRKDCLP